MLLKTFDIVKVFQLLFYDTQHLVLKKTFFDDVVAAFEGSQLMDLLKRRRTYFLDINVH